MKRGRISVAVGTALLITVGATAPAPAGAERSPVPKNPNVVDPAGDANGVYFIDHSLPENRPEADILSAWFSGDRDSLTANWHVAASPVGQDLLLELRVNPNPDAPPLPDSERVVGRAPCVTFRVVLPEGDDADEPQAYATRSCPSTSYSIAKLRMSELSDGSVIVGATFRRTTRFILKSGDVLASPLASSAKWIRSPLGYVRVGWIDSTAVGRDYRVP